MKVNKTKWVSLRSGSIQARKYLNTTMWVGAGVAATGLILISCNTVSRTALMVVPPAVAGAEYSGMDSCEQCHEDITRDFKTADHARLLAKTENGEHLGCEGCHGAGSKHVESGGAVGTIVNPRKSSETCFQCHLDKKGEFSLPYSHPVLAGKMSCSDCHDPHKGSAHKGGGTQLASMNETCLQCHSAQRGPFIFEHQAVRDGCTSCHSPHGSPNQKMLSERNHTLCLKCHMQDQVAGATSLRIGGGNHSTSRLRSGTCWTAGCHEAVHGSNVSHHLRN